MAIARRLLILLSLATVCCAVPRKRCVTLPASAPSYDAAASQATVQVTFLGVGGVLIRWRGTAVMTAPLYSNPTIAELALSEIHTDRQRIDALMRQDVSAVRVILVGHSHYDHLMDVPYIALHKAKQADIVGNEAMVKLLHPIEGDLAKRSNHLIPLKSHASYAVPDAAVRIKAVQSEHSPQIGPRLVSRTAQLIGWFIPFPEVTLWRGEPEYEARELPKRAGDWPAGTPLAYVIELEDPATRTVAFRIYYQDSPTRPPYGYPDLPDNPHAYDLAILTMGGATEFREFPGDIVRHLKPRFVMGTHWEDFFNPRLLPLPSEVNRTERIPYAPGVDEGRFLKAVRKAQPPGGRAAVPCPDTVTTFTRGATGWTIEGPAPGWTAAKN